MKKILFVCHGNICRSPMAEFVMKDLVEKAGLAAQFHIESAATSCEEIGNPVYPPARRKLAEHGIACGGDPDGKIHLLLDYTGHPHDVADPWYTDDFEATWRDVLTGCQGLLQELLQKRGEQNGTK